MLPMGRNSGGEVRKIFLYQKNILFASKKLILSEHLKNAL
ncbi:hypothetical protein LEP1GSC021_2310 [Leptospira noguchii str. 1993005606]|nr:hypothetical protein LEP1GSC021_2310 [Leptospira noguchii str. 1993005606]